MSMKTIERAVARALDAINADQETDTPTECECDNTHQQNDTVCRFCWSEGRRHWDDLVKPTFDIYTSKIDGLPVIHIDTPDEWDENENGPMFRVFINDDTDDPIWNNR